MVTLTRPKVIRERRQRKYNRETDFRLPGATVKSFACKT
jgi:hypothetical protein